MKTDELKLIRTLFKIYYKCPDEQLIIPQIEKRELAIQPLDKDSMIRHLSFKSIEEFQKFILQKVPGHVYYSTAYYEDPGNPSMENKKWLGADLVFDIDADHLPTENCKLSNEAGVITLACLEDAVNETLKLLDVLENELGFSKDEIRITFSGHRGFHVHVESKEVQGLGQEERRELIEYLHARLFDISRFIDSKNRLILGSGLAGSGGRIWNILKEIVDDKDIIDRAEKLKRLRKRQIEKLKKLNPEIEQKLKIHVDEVVTLDLKRLIRVPNSLHGKTGLRVAQISKLDLEKGAEHILKISIPKQFKKGMLKIVLLKKLTCPDVMGYSLPTNLDEVIKVPTFLAIYLIRRGLAYLVDET